MSLAFIGITGDQSEHAAGYLVTAQETRARLIGSGDQREVLERTEELFQPDLGGP